MRPRVVADRRLEVMAANEREDPTVTRRFMKTRLSLAIVFILLSLSALAAPAPWWEWRHLSSGEIVCAQTPPGEEWVKYSGPYKDLKCTTRGRVK